MDDRELDKILEEIRQHSMQQSELENEGSETVPKTDADDFDVSSSTIDDIIKIVNEETEESSPQETEEAEPETVFEEEAEAALDEAVSDESEEETISISEEPKAEETPKDAEEVVITIPEEADEAEEDEAKPADETFDLTTEENEAPEETEEAPSNQVDLMSFTNETQPEGIFDDEEEYEGKSKKPLIIILSIILILAIGAGIYFGFFYNKNDEFSTTATKEPETAQSTTVAAETGPLNPLTGEAGYNQDAIGKRPVAVVVENEYSTSSVRPQWGMNEADIVLEGESEYSTRLLFFWADYTNMPSQIGPARSARPPFIRFSQLFDSVFIHAGLSKSKGNYVGADTVFANENVDHINLLTYSEDGLFFARDKSRTSTIEHTGYFNGTNAAQLLEKAGINTKLNDAKFSALEFNETSQKLSETVATSAQFIWSDVHSSGHCPKVGKFYYDESLEKYSTTDFDSDFGKANLEFENLIFLLDTTEYVVKANYKGSGNSETYCDYKLSGGKGTILSHGTALEITWGVTNGKLWLKDSEGNAVKLNPGKSYIGYGSSNKGGGVTLNYDSEN